jgi:hypothetical protein
MTQHKIMDEISAVSLEDLLATLPGIDISVPPLGGKDRKWLLERSLFCRWLSTVAASGHFSYPFTVTKREKPDFHIKMPHKEIGAECTEAVQQDYAHVSEIVEQQDEDNLIDISLFKWGQTKSKDEKYAIAAQTEFTGAPWDGDSVEKEWAQAMMDVVAKKTAKLCAREFVKYRENILLVYDNLPLVKVNKELAPSYFTGKLTKYWGSGLVYDAIFVESGNIILEFNSSGFQKMRLNDLWASI